MCPVLGVVKNVFCGYFPVIVVKRLLFMGGWQSGQMQRAVNPPPKGYAGSNPAPPKERLKD